ncbi:iron-containing alcohol dehydrogenase [Escherichia coli]
MPFWHAHYSLTRCIRRCPTVIVLVFFSEITPDPTIQTVVKGIAQMQTLRPDVVIGFGGGSAPGRRKSYCLVRSPVWH